MENPRGSGNATRTSGRYAQIHLRHALPEDAPCWEAMRCELWPDGAEDHKPEIASFFAGMLVEPVAVLVAERPGTGLAGFAELSIRLGLAGLEGQRVAYVEGLYVRPEFRNQGARRFLRASRDWARHQGCTAFASDRAGRTIIDKSF
jgi:aminoglycoside 6'-N-acetyltransferase I